MTKFYKSVKLGGAEIHYDLADYTDPWCEKRAETFLLYPGYCRNIEFWHAWVPLLGRNYRVLRIDPRGYGHSSKPPLGAEIDIETTVNDVLGLMDQLDIERVHWVGESTGGKVGMLVALQAPDRIASITGCNATAKTAAKQVDTYAIGEKDQGAAIAKYGVAEWCRRTLKYRVDIEKIPPELGEWWAQEMGRVPIHVAIDAFRFFANVDLWPRLGEIKAPTLLILGDNCPENRRTQLLEMSQQLPTVKLARLNGYDFGIHVLAPELCVGAINEFFREQRFAAIY